VFQSLEAFRGQLDGLSIAIKFVAGQQQFVMVTPVVSDDAKAKNPELAQPFAFTASAAELDAEFGKAIADLAGSRKSIVDQVAAQAAALKAKAAASASKVPSQSSGKAASKKADVSIDDEEAGDTAIVAEPAAPTAPATPDATQSLTADSLFG